MADFFDDESFVPQDEPERWRPSVYCPQCGQTETRFITLRYELSIYQCEFCSIQFEVDEGEE